MFILCVEVLVCLCVCACSAYNGLEKRLDPLELELWAAVRHHLDPESSASAASAHNS